MEEYKYTKKAIKTGSKKTSFEKAILPNQNSYAEEFLKIHMIRPFGANKKSKEFKNTPSHITTDY